MVIYKFSFPNGKNYIGRTKNSFNQRCIEHKSRIGHTQHPLYYAFAKYGWENVTKEVLEEVDTHEQAVNRELFYINEYDSLVNGYNLTINTEIGGDNWKGRRDTPEYEEFVNKMRLINSSGRMHGRTHKKSTISTMKEKAKGRFSLPWYKERYGEVEGQEKYDARCKNLRDKRELRKKDPKTGRFVSK
jgi:group I intron endonuclease